MRATHSVFFSTPSSRRLLLAALCAYLRDVEARVAVPALQHWLAGPHRNQRYPEDMNESACAARFEQRHLPAVWALARPTARPILIAHYAARAKNNKHSLFNTPSKKSSCAFGSYTTTPVDCFVACGSKV